MTRRSALSPAFRFLAVTAVLATWGAPALAAWPTSPYSFGTPIRALSSSGVAAEAVQVADGSGGMFVVWRDDRGGAGDLYAQRLNSAGTALWTANGTLVSNAAGIQGVNGTNDIAAIVDGAGGLIVTWCDSRNSATTNNDIYVQRLDGNGVRQWGASDLAVCIATGAQSTPVLTSDGAAGAIIAWADNRAGNSDIYARRVLANGTASWTVNGNALVTLASVQTNPQIVTGSNGAIVGWEDSRNTATTGVDIYGQGVALTGTALWGANGRLITGQLFGTESELAMIADGASGAFLTLSNNSNGGGSVIYANHIDPNGTSYAPPGLAYVSSIEPGHVGRGSKLARLSDGTFGVVWVDYSDLPGDYDLRGQKFGPACTQLWPLWGVPVLYSDSYEDFPQILADNSGGFFVTGSAYGAQTQWTVAQHMNAAGTALWGPAGVLLAANGYGQAPVGITPDGSGGIAIACYDFAWGAGAYINLFATHADVHGLMVDGRPFITKIADVAVDQGGFVSVQWSASVLDGNPTNPISEYTLWRKVPTALASVSMTRYSAQPASMVPGPGVVRRTDTFALPQYWEYVGSSPARGRSGYSFTAHTTTDSTPTQNLRTTFMVSAERPNGDYFDSPPDSGYSVDNLPPAIPTPFIGNFASGTTSMQWGANGEADLVNYRLYRGTSIDFVPGPGNLIASLTARVYVDAAGPRYYKLTAIDTHGNESAPAVFSPEGSVGVGDRGTEALRLDTPSPNPLRTSGTARVHFAIPRAGRVSLALFDAQGRKALDVFDGALPAGDHEMQMAASRKIRAGLYFLRLETTGATQVRRTIVVD